MKITNLRKMKYEGVYIHILQFEYIFMYLLPWKDQEIYQDRITVKPRLWRRILWRLGLITAYTRKQVQELEAVMLSGAMKTIDDLREQKPRPVQRRIKRAKGKKKCRWQIQEVGEGKNVEKLYYCLIHNAVVRLEDGVSPVHKIEE